MAASATTAAALSTVRQAKRTMRKQMAVALAQLAPQDVARQSSGITQHILAHPAFRAAQSVSVYVSMAHSEAQTDALCRETLASGKRLYVPRFAKSTTTAVTTTTTASTTSFDADMRMLRVADWNDFEAMVMNRWGIREPQDSSEDGRQREDALDPASGGRGLDLILLPGVAFDTFGGRLGHGKGYYDRYLDRSNAFAKQVGRPGPVTLALALKEQVLPAPQRVPSDDNDVPLLGTITEDGVLVTGQ